MNSPFNLAWLSYNLCVKRIGYIFISIEAVIAIVKKGAARTNIYSVLLGFGCCLSPQRFMGWELDPQCSSVVADGTCKRWGLVGGPRSRAEPALQRD
jgi:hypothetical protein